MKSEVGRTSGRVLRRDEDQGALSGEVNGALPSKWARLVLGFKVAGPWLPMPVNAFRHGCRPVFLLRLRRPSMGKR